MMMMMVNFFIAHYAKNASTYFTKPNNPNRYGRILIYRHFSVYWPLVRTFTAAVDLFFANIILLSWC